MKRYFLSTTLLACMSVSACFLSSCAKEYDDSEIWNKVNELDRRVTNIEETLKTMNTEILSLQELIKSKQGGVSITAVTQTGDGYQITFSDGKVINLKNGKDGAIPTIGADGYWYINGVSTGIKAKGSSSAPTIGTDGYWYIDGVNTEVKAVGSDGITPHIGENGNWWIGNTDTGVPATGGGAGNSSTIGVPIIGVAEYQGIYYWTQTINGVTSWLTDKQGNKLPVSGKDAVAPMIQVNVEGYWVISYDGGITWVIIVDANGRGIKAGSGGTCTCESFFQSVSYDNGILTLVLIDGTVVQIKCSANIDIRMELVVPEELLSKIESYMPIYRGLNPPVIDGSYLLSPNTTVYCTDFGNGGYAPGFVTNNVYFRFKNQNQTMKAVDFERYENNVGYLASNNAYISGDGDNFSVYFNIEKDTLGVQYKEAVIVSGTKTSSGIANLFYAKTMVEKSADPQRLFMNVGVYHIFKDGDKMSDSGDWPANLLK